MHFPPAVERTSGSGGPASSTTPTASGTPSRRPASASRSAATMRVTSSTLTAGDGPDPDYVDGLVRYVEADPGRGPSPWPARLRTRRRPMSGSSSIAAGRSSSARPAQATASSSCRSSAGYLRDLVDGIDPGWAVPPPGRPLVTEDGRYLRRVAAFKKLSIFFPMWNEEAVPGQALGAAHEACELLLALDEIGDYELIIVDDASTDGTGRLADEAAEADPESSSCTTPATASWGVDQDGLRHGHRRRRALHGRRSALRHGRAGQGLVG